MSKVNWFVVGAVVTAVLLADVVLAGELTPPGPPGATMKTLQEIYDKLEAMHEPMTGGDATAAEILSGKKAWVQGAEVTGTMPNVGQTNMTPGTAAQSISAGYHDGKGTVAGDADLVAENIKKDVSIFGVTGTHMGAAVPKTGQTATAPIDPVPDGSDGDLQKGVAWPDPRFTDHGDGTVTDNMTGLMWVKAPHSLDGNSGLTTWINAISFCNGLTHSEHSDWRLPNVLELQSLIDYGQYSPALPTDHPFTGVQSEWYWSSSSSASAWAWGVDLVSGVVGNAMDKTGTYRVWPVRAGQ